MSTVTAEQRVERALVVGRRWEANLRANSTVAQAEGNPQSASRMLARAADLRDLLAILDGSEDDYIAHLIEQNGA